MILLPSGDSSCRTVDCPQSCRRLNGRGPAAGALAGRTDRNLHGLPRNRSAAHARILGLTQRPPATLRLFTPPKTVTPGMCREPIIWNYTLGSPHRDILCCSKFLSGANTPFLASVGSIQSRCDAAPARCATHRCQIRLRKRFVLECFRGDPYLPRLRSSISLRAAPERNAERVTPRRFASSSMACSRP